jgi:hypothetical protein
MARGGAGKRPRGGSAEAGAAPASPESRGADDADGADDGAEARPGGAAQEAAGSPRAGSKARLPRKRRRQNRANKQYGRREEQEEADEKADEKAESTVPEAAAPAADVARARTPAASSAPAAPSKPATPVAGASTSLPSSASRVPATSRAPAANSTPAAKGAPGAEGAPRGSAAPSSAAARGRKDGAGKGGAGASEALVREALARLAGGRDGTLSDWLNPSHARHWAALRAQWPGLSKSSRQEVIAANAQLCSSMTKEVKHRFAADAEDHCETAPEAYRDIRAALELVARRLKKPARELRIYDPYYCDGAVARHLGAMGFPLVHNENRDFYAELAAKRVPEHDLLVTNPPYSSDHVQRLLRFVESNGRPALLLMPNYVAGKAFFRAEEYSFVVPKKRYHYWVPKGLRSKDRQGKEGHVSTLGIRTSPFISFWFAHGLAAEDLASLYAHSEASAQVVKQLKDLPKGVAPAPDGLSKLR